MLRGLRAAPETAIATDTGRPAVVLNDPDDAATGTVNVRPVPRTGDDRRDVHNRTIRPDSSASIRIGSESGGEGTATNQGFSGVIDYIAIWDRGVVGRRGPEVLTPDLRRSP